MAKCEVCDKSPFETPLFRVNELGEPGIFRCREHLSPKTPVDEVVDDIVNILHPPSNPKQQPTQKP